MTGSDERWWFGGLCEEFGIGDNRWKVAGLRFGVGGGRSLYKVTRRPLNSTCDLLSIFKPGGRPPEKSYSKVQNSDLVVMHSGVVNSQMLLTFDHASSPSFSSLEEVSCSSSAPNNFSTSSLLSPFVSRNAALRSRGASRMLGSLRNSEACSKSGTPSAAGRCSANSSVPGSGVDSACRCWAGSSVLEVGGEAGVVDWARCQEGIVNLSAFCDMTANIECSEQERGLGRGADRYAGHDA